MFLSFYVEREIKRFFLNQICVLLFQTLTYTLPTYYLDTAVTIQEEKIMGRNGNVFDFGPTKAEENYQGHDYDNVIYQHSGGKYFYIIGRHFIMISYFNL